MLLVWKFLVQYSKKYPPLFSDSHDTHVCEIQGIFLLGFRYMRRSGDDCLFQIRGERKRDPTAGAHDCYRLLCSQRKNGRRGHSFYLQKWLQRRFPSNHGLKRSRIMQEESKKVIICNDTSRWHRYEATSLAESIDTNTWRLSVVLYHQRNHW